MSLKESAMTTTMMMVTLRIPVWSAGEKRPRRRRRAHETQPPTRNPRPSRGSGRYSGAGGVRAFRKMLPFLSLDARKQVCGGLAEVEEELYDEATTAVRVRDLRTLDFLVEELKFASGSKQSCRIG